MLAADHAAKLRKPIVMVKVGRTAAGESMAASHTGHLTGSDAVTSAVFRQFGVTRVDGLDELLDVSASLARTQPKTIAGVGNARHAAGYLRLRDLGRHRRAHGRHGRGRRPAHPRPHPRVATTVARWSHPCLLARVESGRQRRTSGRRCARPSDPRRDPRRQEHRRSCHTDYRRGRRVLGTVHARHHRGVPNHDETDLRDLGCTVGYRRHVLQAAARRRLVGVPHVQQLRRRGEGVSGLLDLRGPPPVAVRGRADRTVARGEEGTSIARRPHERRGVVGMGLEAAVEGVRDQVDQGRAVFVGRGSGTRGRGCRLSGRDEGGITGPVAQERRGSRAGRCRLRQRRTGGVRRTACARRRGRIATPASKA